MAVIAAFAAPGWANDASFNWCGHRWMIRDDTGGPGPNTFSPENVSIDKEGALHMKIIKTQRGWTCAEIYSEEKFGYGTYSFTVNSRVDQLDQNIVLGLFNYPTADVGVDGTNEIDIEFARWGDSKNRIGNFTAYPITKSDFRNVTSPFDLTLEDSPSIHEFVWSKQSVSFISQQERAGKIVTFKKWKTPKSFADKVPASPMSVHLNLWLFEGKPPTEGKPVEIILPHFAFTPG